MIVDSELGKIVFEKSLRAKRLQARILPDVVKVVLPKGYSEKEGMKFLENFRNKIVQRQAKISHKRMDISPENPLKTLTFNVEVIPANRKEIYSTLKSGSLIIEYPDFLKAQDERTQDYFWNSINYFLKKEARKILPQRTKLLAEKCNLKYLDVKIQSSKTRWGSCNRHKNINLSFYLLLLPMHLIDYVILHELCHTIELNHSEKFWSLLDKVTDGKSKLLRNELKTYSIPR